MNQEKKYTAKEAALAVLKKAAEVMNKHKHISLDSSLQKSEEIKEKDVINPEDEVQHDNKDAVPRNGNPPIEKDEKNPDEKQDATLGEKVEKLVEEHMQENASAEKEEGHAVDEKGHIKLAKFIGRMDHKRSQKESPNLEKAVGDKTKDGLVVLKEPKKGKTVNTHLVMDDKPGKHPASQVGSKIPKQEK